jgi:antibiotic biosynthesis monooxygenase (ABM) superfamily enzyme
MAKTRGLGLLMVWADIDPEHEAEYNRWYDEEHLARLLAVPGFLSAARYAALKGSPKYLTLYELEDHNVLRSTAYLDAVKYKPSAAREKVGGSRVARNFLRNLYRHIHPLYTHPIDQTREPAPFLQMGRIDIPAAVEEEFNDWYNTAYIPPYLQCPGVLGARRFVAVEGQPKYLTLYEFDNAGASETAEWNKARDSNVWSNRVRPFMRHDRGSPGVYRRIFPK